MITISIAQNNEAPDIKNLLSDIWANTYGEFLSPKTIKAVTTTWHSLDNLQQQIENKNIYFTVAKNENKQIVGIATARLQDEVILLSRIYVKDDLQRQGIGTKLLENIISKFSNANSIKIEVEKQNKKGQQFYTKHGFMKINEKIEKIESEEIEVLEMVKNLR